MCTYDAKYISQLLQEDMLSIAVVSYVVANSQYDVNVNVSVRGQHCMSAH